MGGKSLMGVNSEVMEIERYSHVMHLVSVVQGKLNAGRDAYDALSSCFPAGTLSGAPKIRAMEIIEELEPVRRGPYSGAIGYLSFNGNLDACITIRTIVIKEGNRIHPGRGRDRGRFRSRAGVRGILAQGRGVAAGYWDV